MKITRRQFLSRGAAAGMGLVAANQLGWSRVLAAQAAVQTPLAGTAIPQFVDPLPLLSLSGGPLETIAGANAITLAMQEFQANVLPTAAVPGYSGTWVWGYRTAAPVGAAGTYLGPVVVASRGTPIAITWQNQLPLAAAASHLTTWYAATDQTLHWADPLGTGTSMVNYAGPVPAVPHLHGGEIPPELDGGPDAWFTPDGAHQGHGYYAGPGGGGNIAVYRYPNSQEAGPLWFHDHALGITRLNVYAGLAGAYWLTDPALTLPPGLHPAGLQQGTDTTTVEYLIPLVLQDRSFDTAGQWLIPNVGINPEHPFWVPEFVGDTIVVNGKTWPFLNVEPKRYRFLMINGSNARTYELSFTNPATKLNGPPLWQIGTDGGYLDAPVKIDPNAPKGQLQRLVLMPGERADLIVDFAGLAGQTLILKNIGRTPYPKGTAPAGSTVGRILQVRVGAGTVADASYDPASGTPLRRPMIRLAQNGALAAGVTAQKTRQLTLNEVIGAGGPLEILVNNTMWDGMRPDGTVPAGFTQVGDEYFSELPDEGTTEVWEIVNLTADAHPIHTHLVQFQLLSRQAFNTNNYTAAYNAAFPGGVYSPGYGPPLDYATGNPRALGGNPDVRAFLQGPAAPPAPNEAGWKDTVQVLPGQVTRLVVRFAPTDKAIDDANLQFAFDPDGHGYVWHCHIIDHEDNEMMRPYRVTPKAVTRTYVKGVDY